MTLCWKSILLEYFPILTILTVFSAYKYCTYHYKHWKNLGVPHTKPWPLFGHFADPILGRQSGILILDTLYQHFNCHRYFGVYQLRHPMLILRDPDLVHAVLVKDFGSFHDRLMDRTSFKHDQLFNNLVNLKGEKWKAVRGKLSPTFTIAKLKSMFDELHVCTNQLMKKLAQEVTGDQGKTFLILYRISSFSFYTN